MTGITTEVLHDPLHLDPNSPPCRTDWDAAAAAAAAKSRHEENELFSNITKTGRALLDISTTKRQETSARVLVCLPDAPKTGVFRGRNTSACAHERNTDNG